jgi:HK97 gp10 family phage protein
MNVTISGLPSLHAKLARLSAGLAAAAPVADEAGAEILEGAARDLAPVATGELRDSIAAEGGEVIADARHAGFQEFGTSVMAAQPFMRPAADESHDVVQAAEAAVFKAAIAAAT